MKEHKKIDFSDLSKRDYSLSKTYQSVKKSIKRFPHCSNSENLTELCINLIFCGSYNNSQLAELNKSIANLTKLKNLKLFFANRPEFTESSVQVISNSLSECIRLEKIKLNMNGNKN